MKFFKSLWFIIPAIMLTFYTLLGFFLVPYLITDVLPQELSKSTNMNGSVKKAKFNPFTFKLDLLDSEFKTKDKKPLFAIGELNVTLKPSGIFSKDIRFEAINLTKPKVYAIVNKKGELNFMHLTSKADEGEKDDINSSSWNVIVENIDIKNGEIVFKDEQKSYKTKLSNLNYNATDISTKKGDVSVQKLALTSTSAKNLTWSGDVSLNPFYSKGKLAIKTLSLNDIWSYGVGDKGVYPKKAYVNLGFSYDVKFENDSLNLDVKDMDIFINDIQIDNNNQKISTIKNLSINKASVSLKNSKKLSLKNANLKVEDIKFYPSNLLAMDGALDRFTLLDFTLNSNMDEKFDATFSKSEFGGFDFIYGEANSTIDGKISSIFLKDFNFKEGFIKLDKLSLDKIDVGKNALFDTPFFSSLSGIEVENMGIKLDKNSPFDLGIGSVLAKDVMVSNKNLSQPFLKIKTFQALKNNITNSKYISNSYDIDGLDIKVGFEKGYELDILKGIKSSKSDSNESEFGYGIENIFFNNSSVDFTDNTLKIPFKQHLLIDGTKLSNITNDGSSPIGFNLNVKSQKLDLKTKGEVVQEPLKIVVDYDLIDGDITRNNPYALEYAKLKLKKGEFKTKGKFVYKNSDINVKADSTLKNVSINTKNDKKLSSLKAMNIKGMDLNLKRLKLKSITIEEPKGYISVDKKGKTNIGYLFPKKSKKRAKKEKTKFFVDIDKIGVKKGSFYLKNSNLPKSSSLSLTSINSDIKSLYQSVEKRSNISLRAKVDKSGYLEAKADMVLKNIDKNTNALIILKDLNLAPLSGYLQKYVGYKLQGGSINTTYSQTIKNSKLKGNIQTELVSFYLGDKVKSKDAINMPLDLALMILRDSNGNVNMDVPIAGNLKDPKFKLTSVIVTAITNIVTGIVTAPFSLLGNILGIDGEKLKTVDFKPSSNELVPSEEEKMKQYAKILQKRPDLKLTITGSYDENIDFQDSGENNESKQIDTEKLISLANERANTVKENLIKLDINADRIIVKKPTATKAYHGQWIRCKVGIKK